MEERRWELREGDSSGRRQRLDARDGTPHRGTRRHRCVLAREARCFGQVDSGKFVAQDPAEVGDVGDAVVVARREGVFS